jgi:hypothetical protein
MKRNRSWRQTSKSGMPAYKREIPILLAAAWHHSGWINGIDPELRWSGALGLCAGDFIAKTISRRLLDLENAFLQIYCPCMRLYNY